MEGGRLSVDGGGMGTIQGNRIEGDRTNGGGGGEGAGFFQWQGTIRFTGNQAVGNHGRHAILLGYSRSRCESNQVVDNDTSDGIRLFGGAGNCPTLANNVVALSCDRSFQLWDTSASRSRPRWFTIPCPARHRPRRLRGNRLRDSAPDQHHRRQPHLGHHQHGSRQFDRDCQPHPPLGERPGWRLSPHRFRARYWRRRSPTGLLAAGPEKLRGWCCGPIAGSAKDTTQMVPFCATDGVCPERKRRRRRVSSGPAVETHRARFCPLWRTT